jgi:succinoglycan biosynthesis transport protein ExoP
VMLALAVALTVLLPKKYTATASVLVNVGAMDPIDGYVPQAAMSMNGSYLSTQIDIINSEQVARRVVRQLKLTDSQTLRDQWQADTDGHGNFEAWVARTIQRALDVRPTRDSTVIAINVSSPEPKFAELMANTFADVYISTTLDLKTAPAKRYNSFFESQSKDLKQQLEVAQTRLSEFERAHGIVASDERLDVETGKLNSLAAAAVQAQGLTAETIGRQTAAGKTPDQSPDVLANPVIAALKTDLARQEARLNEVAAKFGDNHPDLLQLRANIDENRRRLEAETTRVSSSAKVSNSISRTRENEISAAYETQRQRVLQLKQDRDAAAMLQKDVESTQRAYEAIQLRLNQTSLNSQTNQTNVSLLTPAVEPDMPSFPKPVLNVVAALLLGGLLGCGGALLRERRDPRVRTLHDLTDDMRLPVLGAMTDAAAERKPSRWRIGATKVRGSAMANRLLAQPKSARPALPAK